MTKSLPVKTTAEDVEHVVKYLKTQVGWTAIDKIGKATLPKYVDPRKVEALRFIGFIDRDGATIKLTDAGREYADAKEKEAKAQAVASCLRKIEIYEGTLEWLHYNGKHAPTKTDVANYWHDKHADAIGGARGDGLTDAVVFFLRLSEMAGLGKFVPAGKNRDSHLKVDTLALEDFVTGHGHQTAAEKHPPPPPPAGSDHRIGARVPTLSIAERIQLNVEIHIAADAKASTIEEIFKNMRRYLLDSSPASDGERATE